MTDIDFDALWTEEFIAEVEKRKENSDYEPTEWRASGRASKAWPKKEDSTWWMSNGPEMLHQWHDWWTKAKGEGWTVWVTPTGVPAVELGLNVILAGKLFKCFIDGVFVDPDGDLIVVDWKTGREPVAPIQLGGYKVAIEKTFPGVQVKHGSFYLARQGDLGHVYDLNIYTESLFGGWIQKAANIEARGDFIPHPSTLCSACGVRESCLVMGGANAHLTPQF